jgi:serine/threonine protein kinase
MLISENLIGKGGSSQVYKGCLPDGKELAVKILKPSDDVLKEFVLEIEIITALHHKNIISLIGFCFEDDNLLLVYDFLSRGSLEQNLQGTRYNLHHYNICLSFC